MLTQEGAKGDRWLSACLRHAWLVFVHGRGGASGSDSWLLLERARAAAACVFLAPRSLSLSLSLPQILAGARAKQTERLVPITFCEVLFAKSLHLLPSIRGMTARSGW